MQRRTVLSLLGAQPAAMLPPAVIAALRDRQVMAPADDGSDIANRTIFRTTIVSSERGGD